MKTAQIDDPSNFVVVFDAGHIKQAVEVEEVLFPDVCKATGGCADWQYAQVWDTGACSFAQACCYNPAWHKDHTKIKQFTRHMGGNNLGFADGHAAWWSVGAIMAESPRYSNGCSFYAGGTVTYRKLKGYNLSGAPTSASGADPAYREGYINPSVEAGCGVWY
jgi:prepilin-type processing-associated H-X9-DG protein